MKLKQRPEDFSVKESYRFDETKDGPYRVYMMDKQKLSTFDAILRLRDRFGLRPGAISYCGLKDKQGRTEQLIAVDGHDIDMQEEDLRLKYLGRTNAPLTAKNTTSNRFAVTVRDVAQTELPRLTLSSAEVGRLGVVNYFDSQRFGSLKHGQGFIAKDLIRGDFEAALHNYFARPSPLDRTDDAKVKDFWRKNWGKWDERCPFAANRRYERIIYALKESPQDFVGAFLKIDSDYRAMQLFSYQSYLWNEGVRRLLQLLFPREHLFPVPYQAGTLLFHRDASPELLTWLRRATFPLLAPNSVITDPRIQEAVTWVLGKEKLTLEDLRIEEAPKLLFFKHEERPMLVTPQKLVLGRPLPDEKNKGNLKVNIAFTLPPGSYATLVVKRLFHFAWTKEHETYEPRAWPTEAETEAAEAAAPKTSYPRRGDAPAAGAGREDRAQGPRRSAPRGASRSASTPSAGAATSHRAGKPAGPGAGRGDGHRAQGPDRGRRSGAQPDLRQPDAAERGGRTSGRRPDRPGRGGDAPSTAAPNPRLEARRDPRDAPLNAAHASPTGDGQPGGATTPRVDDRPSSPSRGFLAQQREKKETKKANRANAKRT